MRKIAIIGASGEVGFKLVETLSSIYKLNCIIRDSGKKDFSALKNIQLFKVDDISNITELSRAVQGCDGIINAGYIWFAEDILYAINLNKEQPKHIIFTGSTGVFTKLPSAGAEIKRKAEVFIRENYNIPWSIIRPTMIYGHKNDRNISRLARLIERVPILPLIGKGDKLIQPVFIDDLIRSYQVAIFDRRFYHKAFNIGGLNALTNKELFQKISAALDKKTFFISFNPSLILSTVRLLRFFRINLVKEEQVNRFQEDKDVDVSKFTEAFHFTPRSIDEGLTLLIKNMKENDCL